MANKKRGVKFYLPLILVVVAVIAGVIYWYSEYTRFIRSDDAYVEADKVAVSSRITSRVQKLHAEEGDTVSQGDLLVEIDSSDLVAQRNQLTAQILLAESSLSQAEAKLRYDTESIKVLEVDLERAQEDFDRGKVQYEGQVLTKEQFDHFDKSLKSAKARLSAARAQIDVSKAQVASAAATVNSARAQEKVVETQLCFTRIYAPVSGIVAKRWLLPGDMVQTGQPVLTLTNDRHFWISVFLEETKMKEVHIGQPVVFTIDAFDGDRFDGKVYSIGSNTAGQFSLIPPSNASGNFTKVTQRIPLKISIDKHNGDTAVSKLRFIAGMSAIIKIIR
ncbi:MAG TPA: HlyD family secretion protein [Bacteroidales bacterium]|mgnify:CR=1 FL=1|nr:HlyD family secretion protein [Bacteroidales bacterium]HPS61954.1 HlyD family secretion protein [Bacteroidales bacterium]